MGELCTTSGLYVDTCGCGECMKKTGSNEPQPLTMKEIAEVEKNLEAVTPELILRLIATARELQRRLRIAEQLWEISCGRGGRLTGFLEG